MTIQTIIALYPPAKVIDILCKWFVFPRRQELSSETFLHLTLELIQTHVIDGVLKSIVVLAGYIAENTVHAFGLCDLHCPFAQA